MTISPIYWLLWLLTVTLCAAAIIGAWRSPRGILGLPFVACSMWLYFYGYMAYRAATTLASNELADLPGWIWELGQLVALLSLIALLAGWYMGLRIGRISSRPTHCPRSSTEYNYNKLWYIGLLCLSVSIIGFYSFMVALGGNGNVYASMAEKAVSDDSVSAYWYMLFHLSYPGTALCLLVLATDRKRRSLINFGLVAALVLTAMYPHVTGARRGPLYPMVIVLLYTVPIVLHRRPRRLLLLCGLAATGVTMLFFSVSRAYVYTGHSWRDAFQNIDFGEIIAAKAKRVEDNEYVYSCFTIAADQATGLYQYGTGYLALVPHWIPRQWWPDKPKEGTGWFPSAADHIKEVTGWQLSNGAAAGGAAEAFDQFGWLSPLFWLVFGCTSAIIFRRGESSGDHLWQLLFIGILCTLHWMISQGLVGASVPGVIYLVVPTLALRFSARRLPRRSLPLRGALRRESSATQRGALSRSGTRLGLSAGRGPASRP